MLIVGTGGLTSDILVTLCNEIDPANIVLYNDIQNGNTFCFKDHFRILSSKAEAKEYFNKEDNRFIVGIGNNALREKITQEFLAMGGLNPTYISPRAYIGFTAQIAKNGVFIMQYANISMEARIDEGTIVYLNTGIGHYSHIHRYCLISAGVIMSDSKIGSYTEVGIGANFKPGIQLGSNCKVGTGSVITKSFADDLVIFGNPAKVKKM